MKKRKEVYIGIGLAVVIFTFVICIGGVFLYNKKNKPEDRLSEYINLINSQKYEDMYELIDNESKESILKDDFINRNKNIYEGIKAKDIKIEIKSVSTKGREATVDYINSMNTLAGELSFENKIVLEREGKKGYLIKWSSKVIFPELNNDDKVRISQTKARRGDILDRNGVKLATDGLAANVGIVPGKLGNEREKNIDKISSILEISRDSINNKLGASYVKDDMFIPIKIISSEDERIMSLLQIPGIMINDKDARVYPLGINAAHLTGYVQNINAEELEKNKDSEYNSNSVIGKAGLEKMYESKLRGIDGEEIYIQGKNGDKKTSLISKNIINFEDCYQL